MAVEDRNADVGADAFVFGWNGPRIDVGSIASHRNRADGWTRQVLFGVLEFVSGIPRRAQRRKLGPVVDRLVYQYIGGGGRRGWKRLIGELIVGRLIGAQGSAQPSQRHLHAILRAQQKKLGFRDVYIGETHIQLRAEFIPGQFSYLIIQKLTRGHGLLRDFNFGLRAQHVKVGAIYVEEHRISSGL